MFSMTEEIEIIDFLLIFRMSRISIISGWPKSLKLLKIINIYLEFQEFQ